LRGLTKDKFLVVALAYTGSGMHSTNTQTRSFNVVSYNEANEVIVVLKQLRSQIRLVATLFKERGEK
jgi:hypothetical protein